MFGGYFSKKGDSPAQKLNDSRRGSNAVEDDLEDSAMVAEVEENERFSSKYKSWKHDHLLPSDPKRFIIPCWRCRFVHPLDCLP